MKKAYSLVIGFMFSFIVLGFMAWQCFPQENYYVSLHFWCFTSEYLQPSSLSFNLRINENNDAFMSVIVEFDVHGTQQFLKLWIDCTPMSPSINWQEGTLRIHGTYLELNDSRRYSETYNHTYTVTPKFVQDIDRIEYLFNFTNEIQEVQRQIYPEESPENCGIYGALVLENAIHDIVGQVGNKRYLSLSVVASSNSPWLWYLYPSIIIPQNGDWISAKINNEDMTEMFPDRREAYLIIKPSTQNNSQIYAVWEMPSPLAWYELLTRFPYSFFLGVLAGLISRFIGDKFKKWWSEKKQKVNMDDITKRMDTKLNKRIGAILLEEWKQSIESMRFKQKEFWDRFHVFFGINLGLLVFIGVLLGLTEDKKISDLPQFEIFFILLGIIGFTFNLTWVFANFRSYAYYEYYFEHAERLEDRPSLKELSTCTELREYFKKMPKRCFYRTLPITTASQLIPIFFALIFTIINMALFEHGYITVSFDIIILFVFIVLGMLNVDTT